MEDLEDAPVHPGPWGGFPDAYWQAYFGKESGHYMEQLMAIRNGGLGRFSFVAFFLGFFWMAYRRMYVVALAVFLVIVAEGTVEEALLILLDAGPAVERGVNLLGNLVVGLVMGSYANRLYIWDARRNIRQVMQEHPHLSGTSLMERIAAKGGTSWLGVIFVIIGLFALGFVAYVVGGLF